MKIIEMRLREIGFVLWGHCQNLLDVYNNAACLTRGTYTRFLKMTRRTPKMLIKRFILYLPVKSMHIKNK